MFGCSEHATAEPVGHVEPIRGVTLANTNEPSREEADMLMALVDECDSSEQRERFYSLLSQYLQRLS